MMNKRTQSCIVVTLLLVLVSSTWALVEDWNYTDGEPLENVSDWVKRDGWTGTIEVVEDANAVNYIVASYDTCYLRTVANLGADLGGPLIQIDTETYNAGANSHAYLTLGQFVNPSPINGGFWLRATRFLFGISDAAGNYTEDYNFDEYFHQKWWQIRLIIDPAANGGDGALWFFYRERGETKWRASGVLANLNLHLKANPAIDDPAQEWTGMFIRLSRTDPTVYGEARIAPITIQSVASMPPLYKATNPSPEDYASWVSPDVGVLTWLPGQDAVFHDVYMGPSADALQFKTRTSDPCYHPGTLEAGATYFWRIDERDADEVLIETGSIWRFTTQQPYPRLAYEGWDYANNATGVALANKGTGGYGWNGPWQGYGHAYATIRTGSLEPAFYCPAASSGHRLHYDNGGNIDSVWRRLANPIDLSADENYYVSFLVKAFQTFSATDFVEGDFQLRMDDGVTLGFAAGIMPKGWVIPGEPALTKPEFYLRGIDGTTVVHGGTWAANTVYLVVLKVSAVASGNDAVSMAVFSPANPLTPEEPTNWLLSLTTGPGDQSFTMVWIENQVSDAWDQIAWDEIRTGFTWGSVTGWPSVCGDWSTVFDWDLNSDCYVNLGDFGTLAKRYGGCTNPAGANCIKYFPSVATPSDDPNLVVNLYETSGPITVDGALDDWADAQWFSVTKPVYQEEYTWDVVSARFAMAWDSAQPTTLYVAAKVTDIDQRFSPGIGPWNAGDQMEFKIEANGTGTEVDPSPTYKIAQLYRVGYNGAGGSWACWSDSTPATNPDSGLVSAARLDPADSATILYELAIRTYDNFGGFDMTATTLKTLLDDGVIRLGIQVDSKSNLSGVVDSGALSDITGNGATPSTWPAYTIKASSALACGDWGILPEDIDGDCEVGLPDLAIIVVQWLSCTDPQNPVCDKPWLP